MTDSSAPESHRRQDVRPAAAHLGSELLETELRQQQLGRDLRKLTTGIRDLDANLPNEVWAGGKVIAIAGIQGAPDVST